MAYCDTEYKFKSIGNNVTIGKNVYFRYPEEVEIGDNVIIDEFCYFTTGVILGNNIHIGPFCSIIGGKDSIFTMNDFSGLSAGCRIICAGDDFINDLTGPTIPIEFRPHCTKYGYVVLDKHSLLGTSSIVHPGNVLHEGSATGSMTLVTHDLEPWTIYTGIPAKIHGTRNKENILNMEQLYRSKMNEI